MTYCVGIFVQDGLVMVADTRTNAGLDNIATYRKLHLFEKPGERVLSIATSGNLAVSQAVLSLLSDGIADPVTGTVETLYDVPSMFRAAQLVGLAIREVYRTDGKALEETASGFEVTMLVGGQIAGQRLRLFMVYRAGNFIEATEDTPYLQIGEHKYGKPILDRAVTYRTDLREALKLGLISMDSTIRSNLSVGLPIDVVTIRRDVFAADLRHRIDAHDGYFQELRKRWSAALREAHAAIPPPPYGS